MAFVGGIAKENEFIIYGYYNNYLLFLKQSREYIAQLGIDNINDKLSCKFIHDEIFICVMIINSKINIYCVKYQIDPNESLKDDLINFVRSVSNEFDYADKEISSFGLYDTDKSEEKLLCAKSEQSVVCQFFKIKVNPGKNECDLNFLAKDKLNFITSNDFSEKNCYFSTFESEYLFCCAITDYIKCFKINSRSDYISDFKIKIDGDNSYITIKNNSDYVTFFFMNKNNNESSVYEYYIYLPKCENKRYTLLNSLNENKPEERWEKLSNLFNVKTNKYYFQIIDKDNKYGYFTLNNEKINNKNLISNNSYTIDFIVTNNPKQLVWNKILLIKFLLKMKKHIQLFVI